MANAFNKSYINNAFTNIPSHAKAYTYSRTASLSGTIALTTSATIIEAVPNHHIVVWGVDVFNTAATAVDARVLFYSDTANDNQIVATIMTAGIQRGNGGNSTVHLYQPYQLPVNTALQYSIAAAAGAATYMNLYYSVVQSSETS